jgi:dienelactone hydrolase
MAEDRQPRGQANCAPSDFLNAGRAGAADIQSAIDYMTTQSFVLKDRVVVVGQSAGGWDTLALASQKSPYGVYSKRAQQCAVKGRRVSP